MKQIFFIFLFLSIAQCYAEGSDFLLSHSGYEYIYEELETQGQERGSKIIKGKVSVFDSNGIKIYTQISGSLPACFNEFPAISVANLGTTNFPHLGRIKKREFILFCGSSEGKHNLLSIYQRYRGVVASLDFLDGPVNLAIDGNGVYRAKVEYKVFINALPSLVSYPVMYKIRPVGMTVGFSDEIDSYARSFYLDVTAESMAIYKSKFTSSIASRGLIAASLSGDKDIYCKTKLTLTKNHTDKKMLSVVNEIEKKIGSFNCEGEM